VSGAASVAEQAPPRYRARNAERGREAESAARAWLESRGLAFVCANFRARVGELDLVMREGDVLVVVEVRQRTRDGYGGALGSVHAGKQRRIVAATGWLLATRPALARARVRFDVVGVEGTAPEWRFDWVRDAFRA
jgi:putative endonuclease